MTNAQQIEKICLLCLECKTQNCVHLPQMMFDIETSDENNKKRRNSDLRNIACLVLPPITLHEGSTCCVRNEPMKPCYLRRAGGWEGQNMPRPPRNTSTYVLMVLMFNEQLTLFQVCVQQGYNFFSNC